MDKKSKKNQGAGAMEAEEPKPMDSRRYRRMEDVSPMEEGSKMWLVSFTDVMALMLTFFVLLFSMSEPKEQEWTSMTAALKEELHKFYGQIEGEGPFDTIDLGRVQYDRALDLPYLDALLKVAVKNNQALQAVTMEIQDQKLIVSLPQDVLFDSGAADVKGDGARALYALGGALSRIKNKIEIVGHTDPAPVTEDNATYNTNWELSMARASNVAVILKNVGYEKDITVRGMSSGRYDDLQGIVKDEAVRRRLSRRVDIVIMNHDGRRGKVFLNIEER